MVSYEENHHPKKASRLDHHHKRQSLPAYSDYRVSKPNPFKSKKHARPSVTAMNFEKQMSEYTANLANEFEQNLDKAEQKLEEKLADLTDQLHDQCKILERADKVLRSRLGDERLLVPDPKDPTRSHEKSLNELMQAFDVQVTESNRILDDLWSEWNGVQHQILCLAIEIYGEQVVTIDDAEIEESVRKRMAAAVSRHEDVREQYESAHKELSSTEREMEILAESTRGSIDAQLKEIVLGQDKKKEAVKKAMQALNED